MLTFGHLYGTFFLKDLKNGIFVFGKGWYCWHKVAVSDISLLYVRRLDFTFDKCAISIYLGDSFPGDGFVFELRELIQSGLRNTFIVGWKILINEFFLIFDTIFNVLIIQRLSEHNESTLQSNLFINVKRLCEFVCDVGFVIEQNNLTIFLVLCWAVSAKPRGHKLYCYEISKKWKKIRVYSE